MRRNTVAGNWKMNTNREEGNKLSSEIINMAGSELNSEVDLILIPPFTHAFEVQKLATGNKNIYVGAQNCHFEDSGAFTGEVSPIMLKGINLSHVVLGHSERREIFNESNETIKKKVDAVLKHNLTPIFCCGEPLGIREKGTQNAYVSSQIEESLFHLSKLDFEKIIIAYEPIWAIGTGLTASPLQAQEMHREIRSMIAKKYGTETAQNISILYGGSVKPDNAKELFACEDVDGGLVGGASLKSRGFVDIAKSF
ncbi:MAG: triose-phosphate isomerase [Cytophagales bacterium]